MCKDQTIYDFWKWNNWEKKEFPQFSLSRDHLLQPEQQGQNAKTRLYHLRKVSFISAFKYSTTPRNCHCIRFLCIYRSIWKIFPKMIAFFVWLRILESATLSDLVACSSETTASQLPTASLHLPLQLLKTSIHINWITNVYQI